MQKQDLSQMAIIRKKTSVTYKTVVSRDSVRICLTIPAINDLEVLAADFDNSFLNVPCREKAWTQGGTKFGIR